MEFFHSYLLLGSLFPSGFCLLRFCFWHALLILLLLGVVYFYFIFILFIFGQFISFKILLTTVLFLACTPNITPFRSSLFLFYLFLGSLFPSGFCLLLFFVWLMQNKLISSPNRQRSNLCSFLKRTEWLRRGMPYLIFSLGDLCQWKKRQRPLPGTFINANHTSVPS